MTEIRVKSVLIGDRVLSVLRTYLAAELTATATEVTDAGLTAVTLTAPTSDAQIDWGHRGGPGRALQGGLYPCVWLDGVRVHYGSGLGNGRRGGGATDARWLGTLYLYVTFPGAVSASRTDAPLVRAALAYAEAVRAVVEKRTPTAGVGAVEVTRIEDRSGTLPLDDPARPHLNWVRHFEIDLDIRFIGRQSHGV